MGPNVSACLLGTQGVQTSETCSVIRFTEYTVRFYLLLDVSVNVLAGDRNTEKWFFASVISLCRDAAPSPDVTPNPLPTKTSQIFYYYYFILFLREGGSVHKLFGS